MTALRYANVAYRKACNGSLLASAHLEIYESSPALKSGDDHVAERLVEIVFPVGWGTVQSGEKEGALFSVDATIAISMKFYPDPLPRQHTWMVAQVRVMNPDERNTCDTMFHAFQLTEAEQGRLD